MLSGEQNTRLFSISLSFSGFDTYLFINTDTHRCRSMTFVLKTKLTNYCSCMGSITVSIPSSLYKRKTGMVSAMSIYCAKTRTPGKNLICL